MFWQLTHSHSHYFNVVDPADSKSCIDISGSGEKILSMYTCGDGQTNQLFSFKNHVMASSDGECVGVKEGTKDGLLLASPCSLRRYLSLDIFHIGEKGDDALWTSSLPKHSLKRRKSNLPTRVLFTPFTEKMAELDRVMSNSDVDASSGDVVGLNFSILTLISVCFVFIVLFFSLRRRMPRQGRPAPLARSKRGA